MKPKVWIVLEIIDHGDHVIEVCDSQELADGICDKLESDYKTKQKESLMKIGYTKEQADEYCDTPTFYVEEREIKTSTTTKE